MKAEKTDKRKRHTKNVKEEIVYLEKKIDEEKKRMQEYSRLLDKLKTEHETKTPHLKTKKR